MSNKVLIVAPKADVHALAVAREIGRNHARFTALILDAELFPSDIAFSIGKDGWRLSDQSTSVESDEVVSVWWRRRGRHRIVPAIKDAAARHFALQESQYAFDQIALSRDYLVVNRLEKEYAAMRKPFQLKLAAECGLAVPDYTITNSVTEFDRLLADSGVRYIFKPLTAPINAFGETRELNGSVAEQRSSVAFAPVIFQQLIKRHREYRVTVVGRQLFCHEILIHNPAVQPLPDWRLDVSSESQDAELPETVRHSIVRLMDRLELSYGAIDLIEDDKGGIYFLEVNPQGQFLFNEVDTGSPISAAFASLLTQGRLNVARAG